MLSTSKKIKKLKLTKKSKKKKEFKTLSGGAEELIPDSEKQQKEDTEKLITSKGWFLAKGKESQPKGKERQPKKKTFGEELNDDNFIIEILNPNGDLISLPKKTDDLYEDILNNPNLYTSFDHITPEDFYVGKEVIVKYTDADGTEKTFNGTLKNIIPDPRNGKSEKTYIVENNENEQLTPPLDNLRIMEDEKEQKLKKNKIDYFYYKTQSLNGPSPEHKLTTLQEADSTREIFFDSEDNNNLEKAKGSRVIVTRSGQYENRKGTVTGFDEKQLLVKLDKKNDDNEDIQKFNIADLKTLGVPTVSYLNFLKWRLSRQEKYNEIQEVENDQQAEEICQKIKYIGLQNYNVNNRGGDPGYYDDIKKTYEQRPGNHDTQKDLLEKLDNCGRVQIRIQNDGNTYTCRKPKRDRYATMARVLQDPIGTFSKLNNKPCLFKDPYSFGKKSRKIYSGSTTGGYSKKKKNKKIN